MSIANSNKRGQRPSSLYYTVARCVTDVRAVCRMHSGKPEAASCEVERSGALGIRRLRTTLCVNAKLLKGAAAPALIKNRQFALDIAAV